MTEQEINKTSETQDTTSIIKEYMKTLLTTPQLYAFPWWYVVPEIEDKPKIPRQISNSNDPITAKVLLPSLLALADLLEKYRDKVPHVSVYGLYNPEEVRHVYDETLQELNVSELYAEDAESKSEISVGFLTNPYKAVPDNVPLIFVDTSLLYKAIETIIKQNILKNSQKSISQIDPADVIKTQMDHDSMFFTYFMPVINTFYAITYVNPSTGNVCIRVLSGTNPLRVPPAQQDNFSLQLLDALEKYIMEQKVKLNKGRIILPNEGASNIIRP